MKKKIKKAEVSGTFKSNDNPLRIYMKEINKIPLLDKTEEEKLSRLAAEGNQAAREKLLNANLRFVIMIAKKYRGKGLDLDDLISEGNVGMVNALAHFDVDKGYRFITYAVWWIRQAIIKAIQEKGRMIRLPSNKNLELIRIEHIKEAMQNESGLNDTDIINEVAMFLRMPAEKAASLMKISQDVISLDCPESLYEDSLTMKDHVEDSNSVTPVEEAMNSIMKEDINNIINSLEKRSAEVIRCRYGLQNEKAMTLEEIGARYNLTRERVRQIENGALVQLKKASGGNELRSYIA
jgi:RNA polymerase primary sigma factor